MKFKYVIWSIQCCNLRWLQIFRPTFDIAFLSADVPPINILGNESRV